MEQGLYLELPQEDVKQLNRQRLVAYIKECQRREQEYENIKAAFVKAQKNAGFDYVQEYAQGTSMDNWQVVNWTDSSASTISFSGVDTTADTSTMNVTLTGTW